jgi:hypothetical protein
MSPIKLITGRSADADLIVEKLESLVSLSRDRPFIGMAVVLAAADGTTFTSTYGRGNRVLMLGAVTDLQYTLAKSGDQ